MASDFKINQTSDTTDMAQSFRKCRTLRDFLFHPKKAAHFVGDFRDSWFDLAQTLSKHLAPKLSCLLLYPKEGTADHTSESLN